MARARVFSLSVPIPRPVVEVSFSPPSGPPVTFLIQSYWR